MQAENSKYILRQAEKPKYVLRQVEKPKYVLRKVEKPKYVFETYFTSKYVFKMYFNSKYVFNIYFNILSSKVYTGAQSVLLSLTLFFDFVLMAILTFGTKARIDTFWKSKLR